MPQSYQSYRQATRFLNSLLNLEQIQRPHSRIWNLKRMRELLRLFGHPERNLFTVVIGGTKGKGSTGYLLSEILRQSGLRVGFYHSPHLEEPRERIWVEGRPVSREDFVRGLLQIRRRLREYAVAGPARFHLGGKAIPVHRSLRRPSGSPRNDRGVFGNRDSFTYFEILTLLAALLFKERKVDVAVFEAGMGGRLDATHLLPAKLVILTPIDFDHEAYLGETLGEIAQEKAALLAPRRDAVVASQPREAFRVIRRVARKRKCPIRPPLYRKGMAVGLLGDFQRINAAVALRAAAVLRDRFHFRVTQEGLREGIRARLWPGRLELLKGRPPLLIDGAHNPKSIEALCRNVRRLFPGRRKILIFGTSRDKRTDRMIPFLARVFPVCILTQSRTVRAREVASLLEESRGRFRTVLPALSSREALRLAKILAGPKDLVVATGSFYLIGEIRSAWRR